MLPRFPVNGDDPNGDETNGHVLVRPAPMHPGLARDEPNAPPRAPAQGEDASCPALGPVSPWEMEAHILLDAPSWFKRELLIKLPSARQGCANG